MSDETVRQLSLGGERYAYRVLRQSSPRTHPILLLGGVFQGVHGWPGIDEELASVADVITMDFPLHEAEPDGPGAPTTACRAVEQVVDDLGVERINLFGYSYGSVIAHQYAQRHPRHVARLLLGGVPSDVSPFRHRAERLVALVRAGREQEFATLLTETMVCMDPEKQVPHRELVHRIFRRTVLQNLRTPDALAVLRRLFGTQAVATGALAGVPTLVFGAEHDSLTPVAQQRAFAATIDDCSFVVLDSADHLILLERPAEVAALALRHFGADSFSGARHRVPALAGPGVPPP
ncbi:alpha/beta fold hydrolase [Streptomyces sp. NPDC093510]|uniref:alpha/beta fold hydrolase n=1 Tax=Streptomyces sp. NPDC093510 TaxID=3155199 RepID=UPI0034166534